MNEKDNFALVLRPPGALEKAAPGAKRILAGMVADTLALVPARTNAEAEAWFEKGNTCFESDNYTEAVTWYRKAAEQNHAQAQYFLGCCCETGDGLAEDEAEAVKWFRKAAEQNHVEAQFAFGRCHEKGEGVVKDQAEAVKWYRKSAEQGNADAQYRLGMCYQDGRGVVRDEAEAEKWQHKARGKWRKSAEEGPEQLYHAAAEQGDADAQYKLGFRYENGWGFPQDFSEAVKWYRKAAEQGHTSAQENLGACYANGRVAIDIAGSMEGAIDAYQYVKLAEEKGCEGAAKTVDVISALLSPEEFREAGRRYHQLRLSRGLDAPRKID
jgi:TPR repeat protein